MSCSDEASLDSEGADARLRLKAIKEWGAPSTHTVIELETALLGWMISHPPRNKLEHMRMRMLKEELLRRAVIRRHDSR